MPATLNLDGARGPELDAILSWTGDDVGEARRLLAGGEVPSGRDQRAALSRAGLLAPDGGWTRLGTALSTLLVHERWQVGDEVCALLAPHVGALQPAGARAAILDVGCSTGGTLRRMVTRAARVGIDVDALALALGYRLALDEGQDVAFRRASAHALPFEDGSFDLVVCRNAITYTHQARALAEMTRILRPGGVLFVRFENVLYDLFCLTHARTPRVVAFRMRDLAAGLAHALLGVQPEPGGRSSPLRAYASVSRLDRVLRRCGCHVVQVADALECPRFLGRPTQTSLLASKDGKPGPGDEAIRARA